MDNELSGPVLTMFSTQQIKTDALSFMVEVAILGEFPLAAYFPAVRQASDSIPLVLDRMSQWLKSQSW